MAKLEIEESDANDVILVDNQGTGHGLNVRQDGLLASGKHALQVLSDTAQTIEHLITFNLRNAESTMHVVELLNSGSGDNLRVHNHGTGNAIAIVQSGELAVGAHALHVRSTTAQTTPAADLVRIGQESPSTTTNACYIYNGGTGNGLGINNYGTPASDRYVLMAQATGPLTNAASALAHLNVEHITSTRPVLELRNRGTGHDVSDLIHGAYLHNGQWVNGCSIANKENLEDVSLGDILSKVEALKIRRFNMKGGEGKHISATAEDFHAAFGLGDDNGISAGDAASIALICIQQLKKENDVLKRRIEILENKIEQQHPVQR
jgi:hypothetical protein